LYEFEIGLPLRDGHTSWELDRRTFRAKAVDVTIRRRILNK
jgi:hypothetical protein